MSNEKGLEMFFSILKVIEIQFSSIFEMGKGHIVNSATVLSSIIEMGDLLQFYQQLQVQGGNTMGCMGENC